jgi:hypothetical protein
MVSFDLSFSLGVNRNHSSHVALPDTMSHSHGD